MKEITNSLVEVAKSKLTNSVYGTFTVSWVIFHWNFLFSFFFLNETKILESTGFLKNEYLIERYFNLTDGYFYISWILPFILTWIIIWKLPKWVLINAYTKTEEYETDKLIIKLKLERKVEQEKTKLEQDAVKTVKVVAQKVAEEKKVKNIDPTLEWTEEVGKIDQTLLDALRNAVRAVYGNRGYFSNDNGSEAFVSPDQLARLDTMGLIYLEGQYKNEMSFTDKGKFFVKEFQNQKLI